MGLLALRDRAKPEFAELGPVNTRHHSSGFATAVNGLMERPIYDFRFHRNLADLHTLAPAQRDCARERIVQEVYDVARQTVAGSTKSSLHVFVSGEGLCLSR